MGESIGWRWVQGVIAAFTGVMWIIGCFTIPETYAPFILRRRADKLSKETGKAYLSVLDARTGKPTPGAAFKKALLRPWVLLIMEPIVLLLSIYAAIVYGTLYMFFSAFPIVYQQERGWSEGIGGLAFIGVAIGMIAAIVYTIPDNKRYNRVAAKSPLGAAPPEARLPPSMVASVSISVGLFWFAWTAAPKSIPWIVSVIASAPFGFGMVLVFLSLMNYLIDAYTVYAASVLAANSVLRALFGTAFPLFTNQMYAKLGVNWATSVPAFLALACVPFPFLFYKYGATIRGRCKYAAEAAEMMRQMRAAQSGQPDNEEKEVENDQEQEELERRVQGEEDPGEARVVQERADERDAMKREKELEGGALERDSSDES